ncbi:hypothetical protein BKA82DRAFT_765480 [Pisolithus tinctorius]|uniref:Uncharacterized protein n=1 Tax=Pisolithus tinctorius Marx 270 TaxID=870435 RepID=A0A0C3NYM6_PISTI|nr:hypothetical protein BKA82DRAFT_765480 [Pisolithus tinctorius]KIO00244.1 hypothetical protein M404DRAFT_765480 [Pisolithus tinctorius Marx 270]
MTLRTPRSFARSLLAMRASKCGCLSSPFPTDRLISGLYWHAMWIRTADDSESPNPETYPEFKTLYLTHHQDANETRCEFILDDKYALYHGFTLRSIYSDDIYPRNIYPRQFTGDAVALSSVIDDLTVIVYTNYDARSRFAVGLGYFLGQGWVHVICDELGRTPEDLWIPWPHFGKIVYELMRNARAEQAQTMPGSVHGFVPNTGHFIKHAHLPGSILAAKVVWGSWENDNFKIIVDVDQCPGCCDGPHRWAATFIRYRGLPTPGLMHTVSLLHELKLDGWEADFDECSGQRIALGDYGDYSNGTFIRVGNIFEDVGILDIHTTDPAYRPVVSRVSGYLRPWKLTGHLKGLAAAHLRKGKLLALHQPKGLSLPTNWQVVRLLKALSTRLAGKHLVITVVQCSGFYGVGDDEPQILTPLCTIVRPQVWQRQLPCVERRERFKSIREYFYALANMHQSPGTEALHKSACKKKEDGAIEFFSDMFGLKHLRNRRDNILQKALFDDK